MNSSQHKPTGLLQGALALSEIPINWPKCLRGMFVSECGENAIIFHPALGCSSCGAQRRLYSAVLWARFCEVSVSALCHRESVKMWFIICFRWSAGQQEWGSTREQSFTSCAVRQFKEWSSVRLYVTQQLSEYGTMIVTMSPAWLKASWDQKPVSRNGRIAATGLICPTENRCRRKALFLPHAGL